MSRNRFRDADFIQQGASNPAGVVRALVDAIDQARKEGLDERKDAACRLIAHQLAFLLGVGEIDHDFTLYDRLIEECRAKAIIPEEKP